VATAYNNIVKVKMSVCRECKQTISEGASKCHNCGAYQNWRRFISSSALLAGFVLTWISIWAAPPVNKMLQDNRADLKISVIEGSNKEISFMLSNVGNQPAGLSQIVIESKNRHGFSTWWHIRNDLDLRLLEPGKAHIIKGSNGSIIPEHIAHEFQVAWQRQYGKPMKKECDLVVQYVQLDGTKEYLYHPFPCQDIEPINKIIKQLKQNDQNIQTKTRKPRQRPVLEEIMDLLKQKNETREQPKQSN
jgi:ribosomal protein L40E